MHTVRGGLPQGQECAGEHFVGIDKRDRGAPREESEENGPEKGLGRESFGAAEGMGRKNSVCKSVETTESEQQDHATYTETDKGWQEIFKNNEQGCIKSAYRAT